MAVKLGTDGLRKKVFHTSKSAVANKPRIKNVFFTQLGVFLLILTVMLSFIKLIVVAPKKNLPRMNTLA